jgi:hypothetical protein
VYDQGVKEMTIQQPAGLNMSSQTVGPPPSLLGLDTKHLPPRKLALSRFLKYSQSPRKPTSAFFIFFNSLRDDEDMSATVFGGETSFAKQLHKASSVWGEMADSDKRVRCTVRVSMVSG